MSFTATLEPASFVPPAREAIIPPRSDYDVVRRAIEFISENWREQPSLERIAQAVGMKPLSLQRLFTRWAGLSPKAFVQALTLDAALQRDLDLAFQALLADPLVRLSTDEAARMFAEMLAHARPMLSDWKIPPHFRVRRT